MTLQVGHVPVHWVDLTARIKSDKHGFDDNDIGTAPEINKASLPKQSSLFVDSDVESAVHFLADIPYVDVPGIVECQCDIKPS
jgi:hypothetical protein